MKHTLGEWGIDKENDRYYIVCKQRNIDIGEVFLRKETEANAEFIVRACNNHYELLEACTEADIAIRLMRNSDIEKHLHGIDMLYSIIQPKLQQAIAKAEGKG